MKVTILGLGKSGYAAACYLARRGEKVLVSESGDLKAESALWAADLKQLGVAIETGEHSRQAIEQADLIITSPGIPPGSAVIQMAYELGKEVICDVELAYRECSVPIIAITGTNGKSTTTSLISHLLQSNGLNAPACGNIGSPVLDFLPIDSGANDCDEPPDYLVMEVSSYQLHYTKRFAPIVSVWLNLTPDHLDWHNGMEDYVASKEKIFTNQNKDSYAVLNLDDRTVMSRAAKNIKGQIFPFSLTDPLEGKDPGAFVADNWLCYRFNGKTERICSVTELPIIGQHNVENSLAAIAVAAIIGLSAKQISTSLKEFKALAHRLEYIDTIDGVACYNDSKATNPESTIKALQAFADKIVLIAGGRDKGTSLTEFSEIVRNHAAAVILLGEAKERFAKAFEDIGVQNIYIVNSMEEAIDLGLKLKLGPLVLSPACASYDMFKNFEDRGNVFKDIICTRRAQVRQPS